MDEFAERVPDGVCYRSRVFRDWRFVHVLLRGRVASPYRFYLCLRCESVRSSMKLLKEHAMKQHGIHIEDTLSVGRHRLEEFLPSDFGLEESKKCYEETRREYFTYALLRNLPPYLDEEVTGPESAVIPVERERRRRREAAIPVEEERTRKTSHTPTAPSPNGEELKQLLPRVMDMLLRLEKVDSLTQHLAVLEEARTSRKGKIAPGIPRTERHIRLTKCLELKSLARGLA